MVLPEGPTFNIMDNLTQSEPQNDAFPSDDENRPYIRTGLHDYPPDYIPKKKKGRGLAKNVAVQKKKEKGDPFDIEILQPYSVICGDDAAKLNTEICCLLRHHVPVNVERWRHIKDDVRQIVWIRLKTTFDLQDSFYDYVMKQVGAQFRYRHNRLHTLYKNKKGCPKDVDEEQWKWLIKNKWEKDSFKKKSAANHENRLKVKLPSTSGTKKIIQTVYELKKKSETKEWPTASEVWKHTRKRKNGDWSIPDGEEKLEQLECVGEAYKDEISAAPILLVKHFGYVLERSKGGYVPGLGISGMTKGFEERTRTRLEAEAAINRANSLDQELHKLKHQMENQEIKHQAEMDSLKTQVQELLARNGSERPPPTDQNNMNADFLSLIQKLGPSGLQQMLETLVPVAKSLYPRDKETV